MAIAESQLSKGGAASTAAPPPPSRILSVVSVVVTATTVVACWFLMLHAVGALKASNRAHRILDIVVITLGLVVTPIILPAWAGAKRSVSARALLSSGNLVDARRLAARSRQASWTGLGLAATTLVLLAVFLFVTASNAAIQRTFLDWHQITRSVVNVARAFETNIYIAAIAEAFVLVFGLLLALARLSTSPAARPIRLLAIAYIDLFRALPAIIVMYLVGFGLPVARVPVLKDLPLQWYVIISLTLTHSAYLAELYRAGIQSIHWSQTAASKSLGLSSTQTLRYVVIPQAVRRLIPPLLGGFVGLQKDTALVTVVGLVDGFNQAKIYATNYFNLSSVTVVAAIFILLTIPQTRIVDYLIARDARRMGTRTG